MLKVFELNFKRQRTNFSLVLLELKTSIIIFLAVRKFAD
jgi:hypothetical protein